MANIVLQRYLNEYNVRDFGADPTGATDSTSAITNAINAASAAGGGIVFFPAGTYLSGNQTIASYVTIAGAGVGATTIKLKNSANTDLFSAYTSSINLAGSNGTGSTTGVVFFGFKNLTLDGNKANQSSGPSWPIRCYGYGHILEHVEVRSGYSGNIQMDWNGGANPTAPGDAFMPHWYDVMAHDNSGIGIEIGGPTDQQWIAVSGFASGSHVCHVGPNCIALRMNHCHFWATPIGVSAVTLLNEAAELVLSSCQIEGSDTCALVLLANDCQSVGLEVGSTADASRQGRGIQLGQQPGQTAYAGQVFQSGGLTTSAAANVCHLSGKLYQCQGGAIDEKNTSGNIYGLLAYQTSGTAIVGGYPVSGSNGFLKVEGLTLDGSPGTGGFFQIGASSFYGLQVYDKNGNPLFSLDGYDGVFQLKNGNAFSGYSDNGSTLQYSFDATHGNILSNGNLSVGQSATSPDPGNGGTITTANIGLARVTPTANETGLILQSGSNPGQRCTVVNNSTSFSITFAATATSHVAQGASLAIAANSKYDFIWDSVAAKWY